MAKNLSVLSPLIIKCMIQVKDGVDSKRLTKKVNILLAAGIKTTTTQIYTKFYTGLITFNVELIF